MAPILHPWSGKSKIDMNQYIRIAGTGSSVPDTILTNLDLEKIVDTNDNWITERTGIKERRIASNGKCGTDFVLEAFQQRISVL